MQEAIDKNYLDGYFEREKEEVFMTTLFEVDRDIYENDLREDYMEEGRIQGRIEGERKGRIEGERKIIFAMYQSGMPLQQIATIVKIDMEEVKKMLLD